MKVKIRFPGPLLRFGKLFKIRSPLGNDRVDRRQSKYILALLILWSIIFCLTVMKCNAQVPRGLKVGDSVPDITIHNVVNYPDSIVKFHVFKKDLVIVDFWATWCGSCIENFSKMYALQQKFAGRLTVLLVNGRATRDDKNKIITFFKKRRAYYTFPCVVADTVLDNMFPHHSIPHYVWIKDNVVIGITDASALTASNIRNAIRSAGFRLPNTAFLNFNFSKPLFVDGNGGLPGRYIFKSLLVPYRDGLQSSCGFTLDSSNQVVRIDVLNFSRIALLRFAFPDLAIAGRARILMEVSRPERFSAGNDSQAWKSANCFSYEAIFPARTRRAALAIMRNDLQSYFNIRVDSVTKKRLCFVIRLSNAEKVKRIDKKLRPESNIDERTGAPVYFLNYSLREVLNRLEDVYKIPFIDETGYTDRISLFLPAGLNDVRSLKASLLRQGFLMTPEKRLIVFQRIRDDSKEDAQEAPTNKFSTLKP